MLPVAAGGTIFAGAMLSVNAAGFLVLADGSLPVIGVASEIGDNANGADGDCKIAVAVGIFEMKQDGSLDLSTLQTSVIPTADDTVAAGGTQGSLIHWRMSKTGDNVMVAIGQF